MIDLNTVKSVANTAKLELSPDQVENMRTELSDITKWMEKLNDIDTRAVKPLENLSKELNA